LSPSAVDGHSTTASGSPSRHRHRRRQHSRAVSRCIFDPSSGSRGVFAASQCAGPMARPANELSGRMGVRRLTRRGRAPTEVRPAHPPGGGGGR
jgi:hypothetical protein